MIRADVAERFLSQLGDEVAEAALIEKGAPLVVGQNKAGRVILAVYAGFQAFAQLSPYAVVAGQSLRVHVDLPAYTAGVAACGGDASESVVVVWCK